MKQLFHPGQLEINRLQTSYREVNAVEAYSASLTPIHLPAITPGHPPEFPLALLRRQYLRAGSGCYKLRDIFDC
ncbi:MAG: hypothetical protein GY935_10365 [Gammaproteobacteria bacterium]|nr:hypothetical protein [Gammaproteobacteria bacterium]